MSEYFYYDKEDSNLSHPYKRYYLREWKYEDFEDWIYYHEYENIYHSHLQSYIETSRITNRAYRCDGALLEHHWTWQSEGHFDQGKYSYEYYQDAWCDPQPTETSQIIIFPNPALEYAKFLLPEASANTQIRILDSSGKVRDIFTLQKSDYFAVDLAGFAPGIYIITADNGTSRYQGRLAVVK